MQITLTSCAVAGATNAGAQTAPSKVGLLPRRQRARMPTSTVIAGMEAVVIDRPRGKFTVSAAHNPAQHQVWRM